MAAQNSHGIALINFSERDLQRLLKLGFAAEIGCLGWVQESHFPRLHSSLQRPLHEYDILVYSTPRPGSLDADPLWESGNGTLESLYDLHRPPWLCIAFVGDDLGTSLEIAGMPWLALRKAESGLSVVKPVEERPALGIEAHSDCCSPPQPSKRAFLRGRSPTNPKLLLPHSAHALGAS